MEKMTWEEFRSTGLLWFINRILHLFGIAIVVNVEENTEKVLDVYPAKVTYRGFTREVEEKGFMSVTEYMKDNGENLLRVLKVQEIKEEKGA